MSDLFAVSAVLRVVAAEIAKFPNAYYSTGQVIEILNEAASRIEGGTDERRR